MEKTIKMMTAFSSKCYMTLKEGVMDTLEIVTGVKQGEVHSPFKPIVHLLVSNYGMKNVEERDFWLLADFALSIIPNLMHKLRNTSEIYFYSHIPFLDFKSL